jgi:hypothetical protein
VITFREPPGRNTNTRVFCRKKINHPWVWNDPAINVLLEETKRKSGELDAFPIIVPDIDLFIQMHMVKEAIHQAGSKA